MKKHFTFYFLLLSSLPCFAQYFQKGDVQLGYKIAIQKPSQLFIEQLGFYNLPRRQTFATEYHILKDVSLYATFDVAPKSSTFNENEKANINTKVSAWGIGGRWFSPGLFHDHLYFYGDLGYGQFNVLKTKIDAVDKIELERISENLRFSGFVGGFCIKPSKYFSLDVNLLRIGALKKVFTSNSPSIEYTITSNNRLFFGLPFFPSGYDAMNIRLNFIFSTQKNKTNE